MKPVVTLTLNPTIDGSASADVIAPVRKIRTSDERYHPGGGGINVARVVAELGGDALALYLAGGATGAILDDLLKNIGVARRCIPIAGYTRIAHTVFERSSAQEYRFVPEGPEVSEAEWEACLSELAKLDFDYIVVSGSLPRGLLDTAYGGVVDIAAAKDSRIVLDTSGNALKATLGKGVFLVKPNRGELEDLVGRPLARTDQLITAAQTLIANKSAAIVAITLGEDGALIISENEAWHSVAPPITANSAVGAGDSFVGAVTLALAQGRPLDAVLAYGVAAGTAAVLSPGAELSRAADVERLYAAMHASRLI
jgi:6-phosphofructokinase 2